MRRIITGVAASGICLALAAPLAAQSEDEHGCWVAPPDCVTHTSDWKGDDFSSYYTNTCSKRIFILVCNEAAALDHSQLEGCRAFGLVPSETREWRTVASYNPTARYAYAYVGSATEFGNDFACSKRFGLVGPTARHRDWRPNW